MDDGQASRLGRRLHPSKEPDPAPRREIPAEEGRMDIKKILGGGSPYVQSKVEKGESSEAPARVEKTKAKAGSQASAGDRVSVSSDAKLVAEAARVAKESPDVRVDRVEALKAQVQSGNYSPNPRLIAQKMVDGDLDFLR
jgi:negative regulator of flagellin synthesis FlgM